MAESYGPDLATTDVNVDPLIPWKISTN